MRPISNVRSRMYIFEIGTWRDGGRLRTYQSPTGELALSNSHIGTWRNEWRWHGAASPPDWAQPNNWLYNWEVPGSRTTLLCNYRGHAKALLVPSSALVAAFVVPNSPFSPLTSPHCTWIQSESFVDWCTVCLYSKLLMSLFIIMTSTCGLTTTHKCCAVSWGWLFPLGCQISEFGMVQGVS